MESSSAPRIAISPAERIASIDVLRGVAVLGILVMNVRNFSMPLFAFENPTVPRGFNWPDFLTWLVADVIFQDKMIGIFSMLFGAGILIFADRAEARGAPVARLHYVRQVWLLVFGIIHAYGFWYGDILMTYAVCGMLLYPLRRLGPRTLIVTGALVYAVGMVFRQWPSAFAWIAEPIIRERVPPRSMTAAYRGSWMDLYEWRAWINWFWHVEGSLAFNLWRCAGFMIVGMGLTKLGVFAASLSSRAYRNMTWWGYAIGAPLAAIAIHESLAAVPRLADRFGVSPWGAWTTTAMLVASVPIALGHVGLVMEICRSGVLPRARRALAATGRMALSNYLAQTLICILIFDGWALGKWGRWGMGSQIMLVLAIWAAQLAWSPFWLRRFEFGPMEWLWRSLTYWRRQPMKLAPARRRPPDSHEGRPRKRR
jgi:uncharacterized protein